MADHTSGTVVASPLGDFWLGSVEVTGAATGDNIGIQHIMGNKINGITYAVAGSGTVTFSTTSGTVTLAESSNTVFFQAISENQ